MDGVKIKWPTSLQWRLSFALAGALLVAAMAIGGIGFYSAFYDAHILQDEMLRDIAGMVDSGTARFEEQLFSPSLSSENPEAHFIVQVIDPAGKATPDVVDPAGPVKFPRDISPGLQTVQIGENEWRIFASRRSNGTLLAVGQQTDVRDDIAEHAGMNTLVPVLIMIPVLITMLVGILRLMLAPLARLANQLQTRSSDDQDLLEERDLPDELQPFIVALNATLSRQNLALAQQRRFVADAAHELRSPLTAMSLQTQNLSTHELPESASEYLVEFRRGLRRANELVEQLTALARSQLVTREESGPVSVFDVVRVVFEEQIDFAHAKHIELGFEQTRELFIRASELDLFIVMRNLIDNAIRYTQEGGRVDVIIFEEGNFAMIEVQDNGPGVPETLQERIFDPFYRVLGNGESGSGLGLPIVKNIVENLRGEISISSANDRDEHFFIVRLKLPRILSH